MGLRLGLTVSLRFIEDEGCRLEASNAVDLDRNHTEIVQTAH